MSRKDLGLWAIFRTPIVVGVLSLVGLVGALLTEGPPDWIYAALLASAVVVLGWALTARRR